NFIINKGSYTCCKVSKPVLDPAPPASFAGSTTVKITCESGATVRYTTDNSEPTEGSQIYTGPLTLTKTTTLKAKAFKANCSPSDTVPGTYTQDNKNSESDSDGDGLLDEWEINGLDVNNDGIIDLDLPAMGADFLHKDIFVEIDYMADPTGHSHIPKSEAIHIVINAFAQAPLDNPDGISGIHLHVDAGPGSIMNPVTMEEWGDLSESDPLAHDEELGSRTPEGNYDWSEFDTIKRNHFTEARAHVFHYCIFAHNLGGFGGTSGMARDIPSSDLIISLGSWTNQVGTVNEQAGTFMHELGHNLGLRHGGDDHANYEPNYLSIMSYAFQTRGLRFNGLDGNFDYSRFHLPNLDENSLNEAVGLNGGQSIDHYGTRYYCQSGEQIINSANASVDWNCNGNAFESNVAADLNQDNQRTVLGSYHDWEHLIFEGGAIGQFGADQKLPIETPVEEITKEEDDLLITSQAVAVSVAGPSSLSLYAGDSRTCTFTIKNIGESADTYILNVTSSRGWADDELSASEISLSPNEETSLAISYQIPQTVQGRQKDELNVVAVSKTNPNILDSGKVITEILPDTGVEDDSGALDIKGSTGRSGDEVRIPVRIQSAPHAITSLGFELIFDPTILEYMDYEQGELATSFTLFNVNPDPEDLNRIIVGGLSTGDGILKGASGDLVTFTFKIIGGEADTCYPLQFGNQQDDLANFSSSSGCFSIKGSRGDLNEDGNITPADALIAFRCYLKLGSCPDGADINEDGLVTPKDALCLFKKYLGQSSCLD
ncbi:MAG: chitobiase/beta-hexosaminidase C-terminal domain-containing protein, partial [bacterium]